jgi:hypothetical protein
VREVSLLGGATRVWDSENRLGVPPSRDRLLMQRGADWRDRPFEWRRYPVESAPSTSDIALIENASAHMGVVDAIATGVLAPLPLRRFSVPAIADQILDQQYAGHPGDDVLGLSRLLATIEHSLPSGISALRVAPQANALGIGSGARWEVLGTLNVDPALLSGTIRAGGHADRMLWEWRPSWLTGGQGDRDERACKAGSLCRGARSCVVDKGTRESPRPGRGGRAGNDSRARTQGNWLGVPASSGRDPGERGRWSFLCHQDPVASSRAHTASRLGHARQRYLCRAFAN